MRRNQLSPLDFLRNKSPNNVVRSLAEQRQIIEQMQGRDLTVDALGELSSSISDGSLSINSEKIVFSSFPYPLSDVVEWQSNDDNTRLSRILGYWLEDASYSGMEIDAFGKGAAVADLVLATFNAGDDVDTDPARSALHLRSDGLVILSQLGPTSVQRYTILPAIGWQAYAFQDNFNPSTDLTAASVTLAANGGCCTIPVTLHSPMLLESVTVFNNNVATQRTWNWGLYWQRFNTGNASENTLELIAAGNAAETFTPSAGSGRTITAATSVGAGDGPVFLPPGTYWLVVQCQHATNSFALGTLAATGTFQRAIRYQTKTIANPFTSTLDFVAATWTKNEGYIGASLDGRIFGQTTTF